MKLLDLFFEFLDFTRLVWVHSFWWFFFWFLWLETWSFSWISEIFIHFFRSKVFSKISFDLSNFLGWIYFTISPLGWTRVKIRVFPLLISLVNLAVLFWLLFGFRFRWWSTSSSLFWLVRLDLESWVCLWSTLSWWRYFKPWFVDWHLFFFFFFFLSFFKHFCHDLFLGLSLSSCFCLVNRESLIYLFLGSSKVIISWFPEFHFFFVFFLLLNFLIWI